MAIVQKPDSDVFGIKPKPEKAISKNAPRKQKPHNANPKIAIANHLPFAASAFVDTVSISRETNESIAIFAINLH